jgi:hypothetical protein
MALVVTLYSLSWNSVYGQEWAPIGAKWHYDSYSIGPYIRAQIFESVGDTILLGKSCRKILRSTFAPLFMYDSAGMVYYLQYGPNPEWCLLHDFSKNAGDTIFYPCWDFDTIESFAIVDSTSFLNLNGNNLKVLHLTMDSTFNISTMGNQSFSGRSIEYVGHEYFMFPRGDNDGNGNLRCYSDPFLGLSKFNGFNLDCDTTLILNLDEISSNDLGIFPNPAYDQLKISSPSEIESLVIYDLKGKVMVKKTVVDEVIDITNLKSGLYLIEITLQTGTYRRKLFKR